ncbi:MAG TPA: 3-oxoacyl-[acyl-carrier-protein] reductase [Candidatus Faecivivens stercoripullorum]|uniref:3-oxoacyl-[acyl-carrier-protein] reductase n=1 Tax=Candidatus Faecivivens stercoripullorum TaxID=2840805 RepID=A0A9D1H5K4_9FIRM|nr:3-oxoacyl-[acyl-carrier-protein] reductase [Candidatus Faecivivens stercoripullorum]
MAKTALITGASQGIGACIAKTLAAEGFNIAIDCYSEREVENGGEAVAAACRELGVEAECFVADVSNFEACGELVKAVKARFGTIDALVNNAGITKDGLMVRMTEAQFDAVINVNLKGSFNMLRHVGAVMMRQRSGRIVNISSVAGVYGNAGQINYSASKAGVIGMTKTVAKELGSRGVTCNAVAPGFVRTPMTDVLEDDYKAEILKQISLGRLGEPEDIANAVAFLVSDKASYITGQVLVVSGGMVM